MKDLKIKQEIIYLEEQKHPYQIVKEYNKIFNDEKLIKQYRQTVHRFYQLQGTTDDNLRLELKLKIYGASKNKIKLIKSKLKESTNDPNNNINNDNQHHNDNEEEDIDMKDNDNKEQEQDNNNNNNSNNNNNNNKRKKKKEKPIDPLSQHKVIDDKFNYQYQRKIIFTLRILLKHCCINIHPKYRKCMWGMFNPNIVYREWIHAHVLDKIYFDKDQKIIEYIKLPFFVGTQSMDDAIKRLCGITDNEAPNINYGLNNIDFIPSFFETFHLYVFISPLIIIISLYQALYINLLF